ncbi:response regulator transcription factor [Effusibacillus lacus]|uniref:DNA-binding response regulator n=1 Tax=Effusibacillus lacus TaxID=1348429 RepID=A0A292YKW7_9BACL|nr:response regulator transcription factor [Effusibacillus lacus]TCS70801.1 DNA-binding response OmpR family regulator [Effusibacillus lacus]GAX89403.1 DNA-binding response regulator [Effusibacillus lacus]
MNDHPRKIYVVDDDEKICEIIARYLQTEGYQVRIFHRAAAALEAWTQEPPDMFILDIMMPGMDGYEFCRRIRAQSMVPIIMVSARDDEVDKIVGLELGSDDYLSKPFSPRELVARVKTMFRRIDAMQAQDTLPNENSRQGVRLADLQILSEERRVTRNGTDIPFTTKEFELFSFLVTNLNKAYTREQLLNQVWGYEYPGDERAIDDLVKRIRKKLKSVESSVDITTVWGYGYKLEG